MTTLDLLSVQQAAKLLDLKPISVQKACKLGTLSAIRVGKVYVITRAAVAAYLRDHKRTEERWSPKPQPHTTPSHTVQPPRRATLDLSKAAVLSRSQGKKAKTSQD